MHILIQNLTNPQNNYLYTFDVPKNLLLKAIAVTKCFCFCAYTVVSLPFWCHAIKRKSLCAVVVSWAVKGYVTLLSDWCSSFHLNSSLRSGAIGAHRLSKSDDALALCLCVALLNVSVFIFKDHLSVWFALMHCWLASTFLHPTAVVLCQTQV